MRLLLVRHAETEESARGRCYGTLDVGLSDAGREQCTLLARSLSREQIAAVVSSPRVRAIETARSIAEPHGLEVAVAADVRELDFGELEGRTYDEIMVSLPELYSDWMTQPTRVRFPGGESYADLHARAVAAVEALHAEHRGRVVVLVTHGGVVRAVLAEVLGIPDGRIFRLSIEPASVSILDWFGHEPVVAVVNDLGLREELSSPT